MQVPTANLSVTHLCDVIYTLPFLHVPVPGHKLPSLPLVMLPKPFSEKGISLYLCDTDALSVRPWNGCSRWVISHRCVHRSFTECERAVVCVCDP